MDATADLEAEEPRAVPSDVVFFDGVYFAAGLEVETETDLGWSGALWRSPDAQSWRRVDELVDLEGTPITSLAVRDDQLVGVGPAGFCFMAAWSSPDGIDWRPELLPAGFATDAYTVTILALDDAAVVATLGVGPQGPPWLVRPPHR